MGVSVMKSKAEVGFTEGFEAVSHQLPGGQDVQKRRKEAIGRFHALGLPHRRIEEWKYTDLRQRIRKAMPLGLGSGQQLTIADIIVALGEFAHLDAHRIVLVDGAMRADLSSSEVLNGVTIQSYAGQLADGNAAGSAGEMDVQEPDNDAIIALNTAYMTDGAVIDIAGETAVEKPILLAHVRSSKDASFSAVRHFIRVGKKAEATVVEAYVTLPGASSEGQINSLARVDVGDGATLHHIKAALETGTPTYMAHWITDIGEESVYRGFQQTQGVGLARNEILVNFLGEGAVMDLSGAFMGDDEDHIDTTLVVNHDVPACESRELFKGVLQDRARGVFQGKIVVQPIAQKTDGKQMAQALMLSPNTEFDSKPELEIYADDVACGHGSTVAEIDDDLLFYCKSRGIPDETARVLLTESFIAEAIEQVEVDPVQEALMASARNWLEIATSKRD